NAGKVIEFDTQGNAKQAPAVKEEPLKKGEISQAESCRLRFQAQCTVLKRCGAGDFVDCDALVAGCAEVQGKAPYPRKTAEACAKAIEKTKCDTKVDFMNPASLDPSARLPACKPIVDAEKASAAKDGKKAKGKFAPSDFSPSEFKASDFSPSDFSPSDFSPGLDGNE
ncbi:MAG: hypothetical protein ACK4N5_18885, partial [Myxococcales bacterium]